MIVEREEVRQKMVGQIYATLSGVFPLSRLKFPGTDPVDFTTDSSPYVRVDIIYTDGEDAGLGPNAPMRLYGTLVVEFNYKESSADGMVKVNRALDRLQPVLSNTDAMFPVRTQASRQVTPTTGADKGWVREGLVTPFWFDSSRP